MTTTRRTTERFLRTLGSLLAPTRGKWLAPIVLSIGAAYCAAVASPTVFSDYATWDDEGYVLVSVESYLDDGGLYSSTYSEYGPGYFAVVGEFLGLAGSDLDSLTPGRVLTVAFIAATALAAGFAVWLATRRLLVAATAELFLTHFLVSSHVYEPLHPGHYLGLLLALLAVSTFLDSARSTGRISPSSIGLLTALIVTTKINVGGLVLLGYVLSFLVVDPDRRIRGAALAVLLVVPAALVGPNLDRPLTRGFALTVMVGSALGFFVAQRNSRSRRVPHDWVAFATWLVGGSALLTLPALVRGASVGDVFRGAVLAPMQHPSHILVEYASGLSPKLVVGAVSLFVVALFGQRFVRAAHATLLVGSLKMVAGVVTLVALSAPDQRLGATLLLTTLVVLPLERYSESALSNRRTLAFLALLQPLQAYPVAGSQRFWGSLLIAVVAFINIGDGVSVLVDTTVLPTLRAARGAATLVASAAVIAAVVVSLGGVLPSTAFERYDRLIDLGLPGTRGIRVESIANGAAWSALGRAETVQNAVSILEGDCDSFYSLPGMNSFYVFTQMPRLTGRNAPDWPRLFDVETQRAVVSDLMAFDGRLCLLENDEVLEARYRGVPVPDGPLTDFFDGFISEVGRSGDYVVKVRP